MTATAMTATAMQPKLTMTLEVIVKMSVARLVMLQKLTLEQQTRVRAEVVDVAVISKALKHKATIASALRTMRRYARMSVLTP